MIWASFSCCFFSTVCNSEKILFSHNPLHLFTQAHYNSFSCLILNSVAEGPFITGENTDTSSDLMLAQMLQMEFDREYDAQLRREEKKFNGDSKGTVTLLRQLHCVARNACNVLLNTSSTVFAFLSFHFL